MTSTHVQSGAMPPDVSHDHAPITPGEIAIGVSIGRASEYFDFFVYAIASVLVFPAVFFPFESQLTGILYSFLIFSFAFIARPFGTVIFMKLQRRFGREVKLTVALFALGVATAGIAFLPGYQDIGFAAVILLSLFRIAQGVALGGSWDGLPSLLALNAPPSRRGWYAMLGQLGAPVGFLVAASLFAYLLVNVSQKEFLEWGWRYPFYVAFAINVVALFARLRLVATDDYSELLDEKELEPSSVTRLTKSQGSVILIGALAALASYALFHMVTVFPLSWMTLYSERTVSDVLIIQIVGAALAAVCVILSGKLADKVGRRTMLGSLAFLIALFSGFVPMMIGGGEFGQDAFIIIGFILLGLSYGQASGAVTSNFEPRYRYTGAALTADLAWLAGAAFAPLVALGLSVEFGLSAVTFYLLSGALCTLGVLWLNKKSYMQEQ
ncbi:MFS transporter [Marinobacter sp. V034]|uniref:MFS transporter n=1 Tax=Marinobacter sp. V034 TaxID=3459610 RepID=UPI004044C9E5